MDKNLTAAPTFETASFPRRVPNPTATRLRATADGRHLEEPETGVRLSRAEFAAMVDGWVAALREDIREAEALRAAAKDEMRDGIPAYDYWVEHNRGRLDALRAWARAQLAKLGRKPAKVDAVDWAAARAYPIARLVEVRRDGLALCVAHREKTPSMKVYADNHAHCFSCAFHGSAVDVAAALWNVAPREAAARLCGL